MDQAFQRERVRFSVTGRWTQTRELAVVFIDAPDAAEAAEQARRLGLLVRSVRPVLSPQHATRGLRGARRPHGRPDSPPTTS